MLKNTDLRYIHQDHLPKNRLTISIVLILFLTALLLATVACEPCRDVTIENGTTSALVIFWGIREVGTVQPGQSIKQQVCLPSQEWPFSAKDLSGKTVYSKVWTLDDLVEANWKVVIPATAKSVEQSDNVTGK